MLPPLQIRATSRLDFRSAWSEPRKMRVDRTRGGTARDSPPICVTVNSVPQGRMGYDAYEMWKPRGPQKWVCEGCLDDDHLAYRIAADAQAGRDCDYCGASVDTAPLQVVIDAVYEGISTEWTDPANELPYESREGGYQGSVYDGAEIVYEHLEPFTEDFNLRTDVAEALRGEYFSQRNYFMLRRREALGFGWERFVEQVKHRTRYLFLEEADEDYHPDDIPPARMLDELGLEIRTVGCTRTIATHSSIVRVRIDDAANVHNTAVALGTPRREYARQPNRMSPAGIPMFYGAFDRETALRETVNPTDVRGKIATVGTWVPTRDLLMLDLTSVGPVPSVFDEGARHLREATAFLRAFAAKVSLPIQGTEHIDYVPTQVVTEYFRHRYRTDAGERVDGIMYASSRTGRPACVIFAESEDCGEWDGVGPLPAGPLLVLRTSATERVDAVTGCP